MKPVPSSIVVAGLAGVASLSLAACVVSNPPPSYPTNTGPVAGPAGPGGPGAPIAEPAAPLEVIIDGMPWSVSVAGARHEMADQYTHRIVTAGFTLEVSEWPASDAFIQTLGEHLDDLRRTDPGLNVLVERDGGAGDFDAVVATAAGIDGTVLRSGNGTGVMCTFDLDAGADWQTALAACQTLTPSADDLDPCSGYDDGYDEELDGGDPWEGEIDD